MGKTTLTTTINFRWSEKVCKIIPNIKNLDLIYHHNFHGYDDSLINCLCYLGRFSRLESLKMRIATRRWTTRDPEMISNLALFTSLKKLSLEYCQLRWDDLTVISSLPHLKVLNLGFYAVTEGKMWSPVPGQFLQLKFLKIENCELFCCDADESHFPVLEKLVLKHLTHLEEIPLGIGDIPTPGLIRVEECYDMSVAISAMRIKEDQLENQGIDSLQIQVNVYSDSVNSFRERVKIEGLKFSDINQFQIY